MKFYLLLFSIIILFPISANVFAFDCQQSQQLKAVLKQTKFNYSPNALVSCKLHPTNQQLTYVAYAFQKEVSKDVIGDYQLILMRMNNKNLTLNDLYYVQHELRSDAIELESIHLDTAAYLLQPKQRAIGLRLNYVSRSSPNPYRAQILNLYDLKNKSQLINRLIVEQYRAETDTRCNADVSEQSSTLQMLKIHTDGYFDIQVKSVLKRYEMQKIDHHCKQINLKKSNQQFIMKFDGQAYRVPYHLNKTYLDE